MALPFIRGNGNYKLFRPAKKGYDKWEVLTDLETEYATEEQLQLKMLEYENELKAKAGRPTTEAEMLSGKLDSAGDIRSFEQRMEDENWRPVIRSKLTPLEKQLEAVEAAIESKDAPPANAPYEERLAFDLRKMVEKEQQDTADDMEHEAYMERQKPKLELLEALRDQEDMNPESDEALRVKIAQAIRQVSTKGGDGVETKRLFKEIDTIRSDQKEVRQAKLDSEALELLQRLTKNQAALERLEETDESTNSETE